MEGLDTKDAPKAKELEDWQRHYLEHKDMTLDEKRKKQFQDLVSSLEELEKYFESVFLIALKNTEGEKLTAGEMEQLQQQADSKILVQRIRGLKKVFGPAFYSALERVVGTEVITIKEVGDQKEEGKKEESKPNGVETESEESENAGQQQRVPRGFARWDLKTIKLHESFPEKNKRSWVEYWTLRGDAGVGEVLYNEARDMYYFRPFDVANKSTFPLTELRARKASREGRNYYFKTTVAPAGAN